VVAEIDHTASSVPPAPDRLVIGGIDLSDAAQAWVPMPRPRPASIV